MESLLAIALESKLKYWLRSFTRDQFKLQGRSVQLHNLDVDGDVLHSALGLPPSLSVAQARVGKLQLQLPYISNVKSEPIVVDIDKLDLVLVEKLDAKPPDPTAGNQMNASGRSTGYGFADQIADGMTIQVGTVNLMLETRGGSRSRGGASWTPPLACFTMRGLILYTTNERWEVVNLKEARNFFAEKKCIYVFKKLEWQSFSVDLLPHPDMFDGRLSSPHGSRRDADGVRRLFFGGERFLDNISGSAFITMHRTEQNNPLGLEVRLLISEAVCPALSEPGLRALLRFMTGFYVCLNRGDVDPTSAQMEEPPSRTLVGVNVEHIFLGIKDADFKLELLAQSLQYVRASIPEGNSVKTLGKVSLGGLFLRDTFSQPPCVLVQPSISKAVNEPFLVPAFAVDREWPSIYPLEFEHIPRSENSSVLTMYSCQTVPSPSPPEIASQTVIQCQPLKIYLQEKSCMQIASFLADGILVEPGVVRPHTSLNSTYFSLRELDLTVPMRDDHGNDVLHGFTGARLHVEDLFFAESPTLSYRLLKLDNDPACFAFWKGQLPDSSQKRWSIRANQLAVALETDSQGLWDCVELKEPCLEVAMVTADGLPLIMVPPAGGVVRLGVSCKQFISNSSVEQLLFVFEMYTYLGEVGRALFKTENSESKKAQRSESFGGFIEAAPSDSAVSLVLDGLEINFLESIHDCSTLENSVLVKFVGDAVHFKVTHRTLGGAVAISSTLRWQAVRIECVDTDTESEEKMRAILWTHGGLYGPPAEVLRKCTYLEEASCAGPFLDIGVVHMMPYRTEDADCHSLKVTARISGVRLGGGIIYTESLLHRFGVLGPDGGPGEEFKAVLNKLSTGPLSNPFRASHATGIRESTHDNAWELRRPDDVELDVQLLDWLFALEGVQSVKETRKEDACWHSTFKCLHVNAHQRRVTVILTGLQALKPKRNKDGVVLSSSSRGGDGLTFEVRLVAKEAEGTDEIAIGEWIVDSVHASVKEPVEMEATKREIEFLVDVAKAEAEAASRITVGLLRLLQLQGSLGQAAIEQLSSLGSGSLDRYMSPERSRRASSISSYSMSTTPHSSLRPYHDNNNNNTDYLVDQMEASISKSQHLCKTIEKDVKTADNESALSNLDSLRKQLDEMQSLITSLRL